VKELPHPVNCNDFMLISSWVITV